MVDRGLVQEGCDSGVGVSESCANQGHLLSRRVIRHTAAGTHSGWEAVRLKDSVQATNAGRGAARWLPPHGERGHARGIELRPSQPLGRAQTALI